MGGLGQGGWRAPGQVEVALARAWQGPPVLAGRGPEPARSQRPWAVNPCGVQPAPTAASCGRLGASVPLSPQWAWPQREANGAPQPGACGTGDGYSVRAGAAVPRAQRKRPSVPGQASRAPGGWSVSPRGRGGAVVSSSQTPGGPRTSPLDWRPGRWAAWGACSCSPAAPRRPGLNVHAHRWELAVSMPPTGDGSGKAGSGARSALPPGLAWAWCRPCRRLRPAAGGVSTTPLLPTRPCREDPSSAWLSALPARS